MNEIVKEEVAAVFELNESEIVDKKVCEDNIPTQFNLYSWARKNPTTTIAHALMRIEKIFDEADEIFFGFSGGKDSTLTSDFAISELKRRRARVMANVKRDGSKGIDELDQKWINKKLWFNNQDCEWIYTDAINHISKFIKEHGPLGDDTINIFYKCLRLGWQSGVSFSESRLTSWDLNCKDMWIRPMPVKEELGIDIITNENIKYANAVPLSSLSEEMQKLRIEDKSVFMKDGVNVVGHYGLGCEPLNWKGYESVKWMAWCFDGEDEDNEQDSFNDWYLSRFPAGTQIYNLISIRASESFDRYTILKQSDYSTGEYAKHLLKV